MPSSEDNPFWRYSLAVYGKPGVMEACLGLQDRLGLDVNLLLFCCWAGAQGRPLSSSELDRLQAGVADWQREVVEPLRRARRYLKQQPSAERQALRNALKAAELDAESIEQESLYRTLPIAAENPSSEVLQGNLNAYLVTAAATPGAEDKTALSLLADFGLSVEV